MDSKSNTVPILGTIVVVIIAIFACVHYWGTERTSASTGSSDPAVWCKAGPGEVCPTKFQMDLNAKATELQDDFTTRVNSPTAATPEKRRLSLLDEQAMSIGYEDMLNSGAPRDPIHRPFILDKTKMKWVMQSMPAPPPQAAPVPAPTPSAPKKK
jgi:hypothetical protein